MVLKIERAVAEERKNQTRQIHEHRSWLHWDKRANAWSRARERPLVLACPNVSKHLPMTSVDSAFLLAKTVKFFPEATMVEFGILQSSAFVELVFATSGRRGRGRGEFRPELPWIFSHR